MKFFTIIILALIFSCTNTEKENFKRSELNILDLAVENNQGSPAWFTSTPVYLATPANEIIETRMINLHKIFTENYSGEYAKFSDFAHDAFNQKITFNPTDPRILHLYTQAFQPDDSVSQVYQTKGINGLITQYLTQPGDNVLLVKQPVAIPVLNSISYFMFLNKYFRQDDDNNATIEFRNSKEVLK